MVPGASEPEPTHRESLDNGLLGEPGREMWRELGVDPKGSHRYHGMVNPFSGEAETSDDILLGEIRELFQDLLNAQAVRQQIQKVDDANAHTPNAGPATTLLGVGGNPLGDLGHRSSSLRDDHTPGRKADLLWVRHLSAKASVSGLMPRRDNFETVPTQRLPDLDLHYEDSGAGPPLVLLHGLGSSCRDWQFQVTHFSLSELRKYRINLTLAHQYFSQLEPEIRDAVLGNAGTIISFRVGARDAPVVARELGPKFESTDLLGLPNYHIYLKLMIDGEVSKPFSGMTIKQVEGS